MIAPKNMNTAPDVIKNSAATQISFGSYGFCIATHACSLAVWMQIQIRSVLWMRTVLTLTSSFLYGFFSLVPKTLDSPAGRVWNNCNHLKTSMAFFYYPPRGRPFLESFAGSKDQQDGCSVLWFEYWTIKGPYAEGLVARVWCSWEVGPSGRNLGHWGQVLEGDIGI
jgi:hypothetical protein